MAARAPEEPAEPEIHAEGKGRGRTPDGRFDGDASEKLGVELRSA